MKPYQVPQFDYPRPLKKRLRAMAINAAAYLAMALTIILLLFRCSEDPKPEMVSLLILGNSITHHGPVAALSWAGDWGMAASDSTKDYVHQLVSRIPVKRYKAINIAYWERDFNYQDMPKESTYDVLLIRLGENVPIDSLKTYEAGLRNLVERYKAKRLIITGNFWSNSHKDSIQQKVALSYHGTYVSLSGLDTDLTNEAVNEYEGGVGRHPSDKGMKEMALRIAKQF